MTDAFSWRRWLGAWIGSAPPGPVADDTGVLAPGDPLPQPVRSARAVLLPVPHQRQEDWLCVPTAASMVLAEVVAVWGRLDRPGTVQLSAPDLEASATFTPSG